MDPYGSIWIHIDLLKKGPALPLQRVHEGSGRGLCISFRKGEILPGGEQGGALHRKFSVVTYGPQKKNMANGSHKPMVLSTIYPLKPTETRCYGL